jgi:HPt (histidine-containing phosphotransfer) domain-containing protein
MNAQYVYSSLASDPDSDLLELVDQFVQEMPDRIEALESQSRNRNWEELTKLAHQLKGAAGSYGFEVITPCAQRLESAAKAAQEEDKILAALNELLDLCRRVRAGAPKTDD